MYKFLMYLITVTVQISSKSTFTHNQGITTAGSGHASQYSPVIGAPVSAGLPSVPLLDGAQMPSTIPPTSSASSIRLLER